jgi:cell wall-associated NlpC family hydrolase
LARKDKHVNWEEQYVDKVTFLNELVQERLAFLATFTLPGYEEIGDSSSSSGGGGAAQIVSGNSVEEKIWNFFAGKGFTAAGVAAIMGNLQQESGLRTTAVNKSSGATGICQWLGGRLTNLKKHAEGLGKSWEDVEAQLSWLWEELNGEDPTTKSILDKKYGGLEKALKNATDVGDAVIAFEASFERAGKNEKHYDKRTKYANAFLDKFGGGKATEAAKTVGGTKATGDAKKVIEIAETWLNKTNKYVFGGGRSQVDIKAGRFDCSSWCRYIFEQAGHDISGGNGLWVNTDTIMANKSLKTIKTSDLKPGDLMYFDTYKTYGHITICLGDGKAIGTQGSTGVAVIDYENTAYWKTRISNKHKRVF